MSKIHIPTSFNIDLDFEIPEFHIRMFAWLIDLSIRIFYLILAVNLFEQSIDGVNSQLEVLAWSSILGFPFLTYHLFCEIFWNGQSVGKKLLNIRVVNDNGGKASLSQYMIRWLLRASTIFVILDVILIVATKRGKRLGDVAAGTMIIRTKQKANLDETVFIEVQDNYVPIFPQVMRLSDRDINTVKNILDTARKHGYNEMVERASGRVANVLNIQTQMHPFDFLDTLLKDYNYLSTN
ncbi:MAG: hypothetical protein C5B52_06040 [Bacteroidetes bacterium]|nr:MAG: hypothetical protein C5B52_06040 [Bacteroidota bacterium]